MKPLPFDMTPLAKALEMPANTENSNTVKRRVGRERVATYPRHLAMNRGYTSTVAQEQIHALATHVLARHAERGLRTLAVTSAVAGEGKTTITLALAEKIASADKRVLIIDLDTHRGTLTEAASLRLEAGAVESTNLRGGSSALYCYPTDCRNISIMPTGHVDFQDGVPLLCLDRLQRLVKRGLEDHDLILLDCPPLLPVADTHVIGDAADSTILVVRAGSTPKMVLEQALREFGHNKFFAAVLNRTQPSDIPYFREVYGYYRRDPGKK